MVSTTTRNIRRLNKKYKQRTSENNNSSEPIRSKRKHSSPLPATNFGVSRVQLIKNLGDPQSSSCIKKFKAVGNEQDYDQILLPDDIKDIDQLYLMEEQIDKMFQNIQIAANDRCRILYISADKILSNDPPLPSIEDTDIIVVPIPLEINGQINLAVFNLLTSTTWLFCRYYKQKLYTFDEIKNILEQNYNTKFYILPKTACDKLINTLPNSYNDAILVFRTAEELFFTGTVKKFENFDVDAERKRYSEIYDMIHTDDWDGVWPLTLQSENREIIDPEENDGTTRNRTTATPSSSNDIQVLESSENGGGTNTAGNNIDDARSSISDFYDFDDVQPPHSPRHPSDSTESDSTVFSSDILTYNDGSINVNSEIDVELLPVNNVSSSTASTQILSAADTDSNNADNEMDTSESPSSCYGPDNADKYRNDFGYNVSPARNSNFDTITCSSLSCYDSDDPSEEEIVQESSPCHYTEACISTCTHIKFNEVDRSAIRSLMEKSIALQQNLYKYWKTVRKLSEKRETIIKEIEYHLRKPKRYATSEATRINIKLENIELLLNIFIPLCPRWKVTYQRDSDKKIIIHKGFIYKNMDTSDYYRCLLTDCDSVMYINNFGILIEGSFCNHRHPGFEEYTEDVPLPKATPAVLTKVLPIGEDNERNEKFSKLINFLDKTLNEVVTWKCNVQLCKEEADMFNVLIAELEMYKNFNVGPQVEYAIKNTLLDTNNYLKNIRIDKI